jgi:hypothetical protein
MTSTSIPSRLDHDLALRLCNTASLTDTERATCFLVALAAVFQEPVQPKTLSAFAAILRTTATS